MDLHGLKKGGLEGLLAQHWETKDGKPLQLHDLGQYLRLVDSYDQLVRYADSQLAELFRSVEALALPGPTLWIVTADHGEDSSHGHDTHI